MVIGERGNVICLRRMVHVLILISTDASIFRYLEIDDCEVVATEEVCCIVRADHTTDVVVHEVSLR